MFIRTDLVFFIQLSLAKIDLDLHENIRQDDIYLSILNELITILGRGFVII